MINGERSAHEAIELLQAQPVIVMRIAAEILDQENVLRQNDAGPKTRRWNKTERTHRIATIDGMKYALAIALGIQGKVDTPAKVRVFLAKFRQERLRGEARRLAQQNGS